MTLDVALGEDEEKGRKESQSYHSAPWLSSQLEKCTVEAFLLWLSLGDVSCIRILWCTLTANVQPKSISHSWVLSGLEHVFQGMKENMSSIIAYL